MHAPRWRQKITLRFRSLFHRNTVEQDLDEELLYHIDQLTAANQARGMNPAAAHLAALRAMQGIEQQKEACRDTRQVAWVENLARDLRYALRMLRKSPAFTTVAILSLALGIGANTAIFSLIDTLLIRPLPVPHPERLRLIDLNRGEREPQFSLTYTLFEALKNHNQVFSSLFTWSGHRFQMQAGPDMVHVDGVVASGDYFQALGVAPLIGRTFTPADDHPTGGKDGPVAVISEKFWTTKFQRDPAVVGSALTLDQIVFNIVGVMPQTFFGAGMDTRPDIWVPLAWAPRVNDPKCMASRSCWWLISMGRLKDGVTPQQSDAALEIASPAILHDAAPDWGRAGTKRFLSWAVGATSGAEGWSFLRLQFSNPLAILMTLVAFVLLIACANLANLLLARAMARHREIGVRLAMGAGRGRIIRQLLTESALLSLLGGAVGTLFALWLTRILAAFLENPSQSAFDQAVQLDLHPDWRVVLFTLTIAVGTGMLFGLVPALRATRVGIGSSLKESSHNVRGQSRNQLGRFTLLLQAAFSVVLVAAAGLFAGSLHGLLTLNIGFNPKNVVTLSVDTDKRPEKGVALANLYSRLLERVNGIPGVKAASLMWMMPLSNGGWDENLSVPGQPRLSESQSDTCLNSIGPAFFHALEIPLLAGRQFTTADSAASEKVAIINQLAARRFFPNINALGRQIKLEGSLLRVVGIAGNIKYWNLRDTEPPELYIPYTQQPGNVPSLTFVVKSNLQVSSLYPEFHTALRSVASDIPIGSVTTMDEQVSNSIGRERLMASLSIFFGLLALLLTAIGLNGTLAYSVTRRTSEIGIRMALGAQRGDVVRLVLAETAGFVGAGLALGVTAVLALSKLAAGMLYGIRPNDPANLTFSVTALLAVALMAAATPALRAVRLDPTRALREE